MVSREERLAESALVYVVTGPAALISVAVRIPYQVVSRELAEPGNRVIDIGQSDWTYHPA